MLDNAAESWKSTLEHELLSRKPFETSDQARREVAGFIAAYNHRRPTAAPRCSRRVAFEHVLAERAEADRNERAA